MNQSEQSQPAILILFGITGDLAGRKLLPAIYHLFASDIMHPESVVLGVSRRDVSEETITEHLKNSVIEVDGAVDETIVQKVIQSIQMYQMDLSLKADYEKLLQDLHDIESEKATSMNRLYYLSIPPQSYDEVVDNLGATGHAAGPGVARLMVEKPFGYDLASAHELLKSTGAYFDENQIYRIDHYAARPEMDELMNFRLGADIYPIWNGSTFSSVTITAYESLDIEGRAVFYDKIGALRDFIQSHLLQVLALVIMQRPTMLDSQNIHAAREAALAQLRPITSSMVDSSTVRGQYQGYVEEAKNPESTTETYAAITVQSNDPTWQNVPMTLRTGKAMSEKLTEVRLELRSGGAVVFGIQPDTGFSCQQTDSDESRSDIVQVLQSAITRSSNQRESQTGLRLDAYERVLSDALIGDHTVFTSQSEVLSAWQIVNDVVAAWSVGRRGMHTYPKGSSHVD